MSDLNKKQFEAVETVNGPVVIIAGPGTGKTKTLVERTVNILVNEKMLLIVSTHKLEIIKEIRISNIFFNKSSPYRVHSSYIHITYIYIFI